MSWWWCWWWWCGSLWYLVGMGPNLQCIQIIAFPWACCFFSSCPSESPPHQYQRTAPPARPAIVNNHRGHLTSISLGLKEQQRQFSKEVFTRHQPYVPHNLRTRRSNLAWQQVQGNARVSSPEKKGSSLFRSERLTSVYTTILCPISCSLLCFLMGNKWLTLLFCNLDGVIMLPASTWMFTSWVSCTVRVYAPRLTSVQYVVLYQFCN